MEAILGILFGLVLPISAIFFAWKWYRAKKQLAAANQTIQKLKSELKEQLAITSQTIRHLNSDLEKLKAKAAPLSQYQGIEGAKAVVAGGGS